MTLTKEALINRVRQRVRSKSRKRTRQQLLFPEMAYTPIPRKRARELVNTTFEIIKNALSSGDHLLIPGFGKFQVRFRWARKGRNPRTGEELILKSRRRITFHCSPVLKKKINTPPEKD